VCFGEAASAEYDRLLRDQDAVERQRGEAQWFIGGGHLVGAGLVERMSCPWFREREVVVCIEQYKWCGGIYVSKPPVVTESGVCQENIH
jgi:hypothetical protein